MNRLSRVGLAAALAAISAVAVSQGAGGPPSPEAQAKTAIEARQAVFKLIANQNGPVGGMMRNTREFDQPECARRVFGVRVWASGERPEPARSKSHSPVAPYYVPAVPWGLCSMHEDPL